MPLLIHIMVLFWLNIPTALSADCTVVKLQHPLRSTQITEVVLVSGGGKSGGKSSQIDVVLFLWRSGRPRWWPWSLFGPSFIVVGVDEEKVRLKSMSWVLSNEKFWEMKCVDAKATRMEIIWRVGNLALIFISWLEEQIWQSYLFFLKWRILYK